VRDNTYMPIEYASSERSTLGVEWELLLIDRETGDLRQDSPEVLAAMDAAGPTSAPGMLWTHEMLCSTVELVTGVCRTTSQARAQLDELLGRLRAAAAPRGIDLTSAGTHPYARATDQRTSPKGRYERIVEEYGWWGRRMLINGIHVHVGVDATSKLLPIVQGLTAYLAPMLALSVSSPFWEGEDTGYSSMRSQMFQQLPSAGLPPRVTTSAEFDAYAEDLLRAGVVHELNEIRWDIRPVPRFGTVEVRVFDGLPTLDEIAAVAALTQCLVDDLSARLDRGEDLPLPPPWLLRDDKWRTSRYGLAAEVLVPPSLRDGAAPCTDDRAPAGRLLELLSEDLAPVAERLGCAEDLARVRDIVRDGTSAERQRRVLAGGGGLRDVVDLLVAETATGSPTKV
jgi:glutamate---cysteine ligase / carboxylate-amine ligase